MGAPARIKIRPPAIALYLIAMTLRLPRSNARKLPDSALDYEIAQEQAAALGRLGRALEAALAALSRHDRARTEDAGKSTTLAASGGVVRERLLQEASYALWCFVIQREACGLRDQRLIVRKYCVPREVQNRMGVFGRAGSFSRTTSA
jgi:hypothetical protein